MGTVRRTQDSIERFQSNSLTKSFLAFGLHQFIGMYGVPVTAPIVFSLGFKFLLLFGQNYSKREFYSRVTETPYFPVQVLFAFALGWLLGRSLRHKSVLWVWVIPLAILLYSFITLPISVLEGTSIVGQLHFRLSHFFGWGCRPALHCFDQVLITLPFYSSLAYAMGAFLARKTVQPSPTASRTLTVAIMSMGLIIILAIGIDLVFSIRQTGWQSTYWMILTTPVGLGLYLVYVASTRWRKSFHSTWTPL